MRGRYTSDALRERSARPGPPGREFTDWMAGNRGGYLRALADLVAIDTCSPHEQRAFGWLRDFFADHGATVTTEPRHPDLAAHRDANRNAHSTLPDSERSNLRVSFPPAGAGVRTLFSAHVDVVPPGPEFASPYRSAVAGGFITGRGTADTKGNIVMLAAAHRFATRSGRPLTRQAELDLVIEEEIGGNGALSAVLYGRRADEAVVLEPTGLEVFHGHRGCLEFTATFTGRSSHMGGDGLSAIDGALQFVALLKELEATLIGQARRDACFAGWRRPVQINVGAIDGGEWHGSVPERCRLRCSFGFHPEYSVPDIRSMLAELLTRLPRPWSRGRAVLEYTGIHNGAYLADPDVAVARDLRAAARAAGVAATERRAWNVSCDARLYQRHLDVPTVVFGAGSLRYAHSSAERLDIEEWTRGVAALATFLTSGDAAAPGRAGVASGLVGSASGSGT